MANIELRVRGQRLLMVRGYVVAGTVRYLTIKAALSEDWRGREVWAYLEYGDKKYKTQLNANGESTARAGLNLSAGEWSIYLMGYGKDADGNETCITSDRVTLNVYPTGASGGEQLPADEEGAGSLNAIEMYICDFASAEDCIITTGGYYGTKRAIVSR